MANKPGRLYRSLSKFVTLPVFRFLAEGWTTFNDDQIRGITITRGLGEPGGGVAVSTLEVEVATPLHAVQLTGREARIYMNSTQAEQLKEHCEYQGAASDFMNRFRGRIGPVSVTDTGKPLTTSTNLLASSWIAAEMRSGKVQTITQPVYIDDAVRSLMRRQPSRYTMYRYGARDILNTTLTDTTYSESIDKFTTDFEVLIGDLRNGHARMMFLSWRLQEALNRISTQLPVLRSQAIANATWEQPNEAHSTMYAITYKDANGVLQSTTRYSESNIEADSETKALDWTHFNCSTNQWDLASKAIVYRETTNMFRLPSLTVDLLHLLNSSKLYDRRIAGQMLTLETADTVNLSGDWPGLLRGVYVVTGITERITSESWEMELSLATMIETLGEYSPNVPARVWDSATYPWDEETRKWDEA